MTVSKQIHVRLAYCVVHKITRQWVRSGLIILGLWMFQPAMAADRIDSDVSNAGNSLVLCIPSGMDSLDPTNYRSRITQIVLKSMFDSLTTRDSANDVIPQLAESWRSINETQWQFKLRRGVQFHNGHRLTATDVKFTLDRVVREGALDGRTSPRKSLLEPVSQVIVEDDRTLFVKTRHPWPNLPLMLSLQEIVPANYMKAVGSHGFEAHPVGTGPFKFIRNKAGNEIVLERFEGYYGGSPLRPPVQTAPLKQLIFKVVPSQLDRLAMLKAGRCDIIFNLPPESIPIIKMSPGLRILKVPPTRSFFAEINCTRPPLNDRRVRQALNYAVDIETIVRQKLQGHGKVLATVMLPNAFGYNSQLHPYPYNPTVARQLLDAAAYPGDRPIVIYSNRDDLVFADSIALFLTKLGLKTRLMIAPSFRPQTMGPDAPWDIFVGSWGNSTLDPAGILPPKFRSNSYGNFSGFASEELDRLMLKAQSTMDKALRTDYYHKIQAVIFNEAPMIFGYAPDEYFGMAQRVRNFRPSATGMIDLRDVMVKERE